MAKGWILIGTTSQIRYHPFVEPEEWRPVQFITTTYPNGEGITTDGEAGLHHCYDTGEVYAHLSWLNERGFIIYSMQGSRDLADSTTHDRFWEFHYWNGRVSHMIAAFNIKIYPFALISQDVDSVWPFFEWLREVGIPAGSLTSIARKTWRLSLREPVSLYDQGHNGKLALYGGRREALSGKYVSMRYQDLSSAFPSAMAGYEFPRSVKEWPARFCDTGYALATVQIPPGLPWGPLPCRVGKNILSYGYGEQTDWWTFEDLRHVLELEGKVAIHKAYKGSSRRPIFRDWYDYIVVPARLSLTGDALKASKAVFNRLWGSFAIGGQSYVRSWSDDKQRMHIEHTVEQSGLVNQAYIASLTASLVRSRLLSAMYKATDVVYADTDGLISSDRESLGDGWRIKRRMETVEIHSCANYKWDCALCGIGHVPTHYSMMAPKNSSRRHLESLLKRPDMPVSPLFGATVQPDNLATLRERFKYEQPIVSGADHIAWDTLGERPQQRLAV